MKEKCLISSKIKRKEKYSTGLKAKLNKPMTCSPTAPPIKSPKPEDSNYSNKSTNKYTKKEKNLPLQIPTHHFNKQT